MFIYIICAVRSASEEAIARTRNYAESLRRGGHTVHFPPDDAPQDDPTGKAICEKHRQAMLAADQVHVFWDEQSFGSHFDLGMAYVLGKEIVPVCCERPVPTGKSYWAAILCA